MMFLCSSLNTSNFEPYTEMSLVYRNVTFYSIAANTLACTQIIVALSYNTDIVFQIYESEWSCKYKVQYETFIITEDVET